MKLKLEFKIKIIRFYEEGYSLLNGFNIKYLITFEQFIDKIENQD